jgi:hypothetical protein
MSILALSYSINYNTIRMKLFSLFKSPYYKPAWVYKAEGQLWRILFSHGDLAAGEYRDNEKKRVTFFCLDIRTGEERWNIHREGEGWWTTTEGVYGNSLYLHAFAKPDLPHPKHITSVDMHTGQIRWDHPELTFLYANDTYVVAEHREMGRDRCYRIDSSNGEIYETIEDRGTIATEKREAHAHDPHTKLTFPETYNPEYGDHGTFARIVSGIQKVERLVDPIEVLQYDNYLLICFHKLKGCGANGTGFLIHELIIYDKDDLKEVYRDTLFENASAPVPDGFFVRENFLYYIRGKTEFVAVNLQKQV